MKSSEKSCKHDELAGLVSEFMIEAVDLVAVNFRVVSFCWLSYPDDDLYGVDVKILPSIFVDDVLEFDQTDESALNVLNAFADCSLFAVPLLYQPSFGDKSCGRNKLAEQSDDPKLSIE